MQSMYIIIILVFCVNAGNGYKRDREPSRVPMKMLKRPSEKSRKLQNYVQGRFSKNVPKSSEVHDLIKNNATRKKSTQESGLHKK